MVLLLHPLVLLTECENCGLSEERTFEDSWTGKSLCLECLIPIASLLTNSPQTEGDNLEELLADG